MKRIPITGWLGAALLAFALMLAVTAAPTAEATPDAMETPAGTITLSEARAQCQYRAITLGHSSWYIWARYFHYGTAHVTQCQLSPSETIGQGSWIECWQYVWNISNPTWSKYKSGFYPNISPCW